MLSPVFLKPLLLWIINENPTKYAYLINFNKTKASSLWMTSIINMTNALVLIT